jgi:TubC N-terminal docking domain
MSALPLIEAVQRAGGAITLQGDRLRLSAPEPLPEDLLQELRTRKAEVIDHLQHTRGSGLVQAPAAALENRSVPRIEAIADWVAGVTRLSAMPPPPNYPQHAWRQLIIDAERFLSGWAQEAAAFGWRDWEIFGCCRHAPWGRIQGMDLVLLMHGRELTALTATEAVIRTRTGTRQTYRRKPWDPLHYAERCLVWELNDE